MKKILIWAFLLFFAWVIWQTAQAGNMGLRNKTFWDWMELLIVPAALAAAGLWFSFVQKQTELEIAERAREVEREIAVERQRQQTLEAYFDRIGKLILENGLGSDAEESVKRLARTRTLTALRELDGKRNRLILQFLLESKLLPGVVSLEGAELSGINLRLANLRDANLSSANLNGANLDFATLHGANLAGAKLNKADLFMANLNEAKLDWVELNEARLGSAELQSARFYYARLNRASLVKAKLIKANLSQSYLEGTNLREADLSGANLIGANLSGANLSGANLQGAKVQNEQLIEAKDLTGATMPDGRKYEEWVAAGDIAAPASPSESMPAAMPDAAARLDHAPASGDTVTPAAATDEAAASSQE